MAHRRNSRTLSHLALWPLFLVGGAYAAHPFITDDTKTQGKGHFELQLGAQYTRTPVEDVTLANFQFQPQLTYGAEETLDLILRPTYNVNVASGGASARASGFGDTNLEFKWRFWQQETSTLAVKAGTGIPSGNFDRGLDSGQSTPRAYLLVGQTTSPFEFYANLGATRNANLQGAREWLGHVSAVGLWSVDERLQLGLDLAADQNPLRNSSQWPAVVLIGAIYTLLPGCDLDFGYQRGLNHSAPNNQFLLGATVRW